LHLQFTILGQQNAVTSGNLSCLKCTKIGGWGFAPDPTGGAYSAPPDLVAGVRGAYF